MHGYLPIYIHYSIVINCFSGSFWFMWKKWKISICNKITFQSKIFHPVCVSESLISNQTSSFFFSIKKSFEDLIKTESQRLNQKSVVVRFRSDTITQKFEIHVFPRTCLDRQTCERYSCGLHIFDPNQFIKYFYTLDASSIIDTHTFPKMSVCVHKKKRKCRKSDDYFVR